MRTALDEPLSALDDDEQKVVANIRTHGWFGHHIAADDEGPGFTYTTGFWVTLGFPEVIVFSLKRDIAHSVLWDVFRDIKAGRQIPVGQLVKEVFANTGAYLIPVGKQHYPDFLGWSR